MEAIVYDTETSGLIQNSAIRMDKNPHVIELFALKLELVPRVDGGEDWVEIDTLDILVKPPFPIDDEIKRITGITNEMVADCPNVSQIWPSVVEFFTGADMMVAHNTSYDKAIVGNEHRRVNGPDSEFPFPKKEVCTVESSVHLTGKRMKLIDLYVYLFGEEFESAHRAENDVRATARSFKRLWKDGEI